MADGLTCQRLYGGSIRHCNCMLPDEGGWLPCPPSARGAERYGVLALERMAIAPPAAPLFTFAASNEVAKINMPAPELRLTQTGECCEHCGAFALVRTGTCLMCQVCHESSGGCS